MTETVDARDDAARGPNRGARTFVIQVVSVALALALASEVARLLGVGSLFIGVVVFGSVIAVAAGIARNRPREPVMWWFVATALLMYLGAFVTGVCHWGSSGVVALPDVFRLVGYVAMTVGLIWWIANRRTQLDMTPLIDGVLISLGVLLVTWVLFLSPVLSLTGTPEPAIPAGFYPAFNAGMLTLTMYLVVASRGTNRSVLWMSVGFAVFFVGDMAAAVAVGGGPYPPAWLYDITFGVGVVSFAAAACNRSMTAVADLPLPALARTGGRGAALLALLVTCALVPLLITATTRADLVFRTVILMLVVLVTFLRGERALRRAQRSEDRARHDAGHDSLTGLPNRAALGSYVAAGDSTVLFVDLDNFKIVNDSYGHRVGDDLIAAAASRIRTAVAPGDTVVRYSGDEFVVVTDLDRASSESLARNIIDSVSRPFALGPIILYVTAAVGIARGATKAGPGGLDDVIREADTAMYYAKKRGAGALSYFDESLRHTAMRELAVATALRGAVARGEFEVYYQPIVATRSRRTLVFEALLRWHHDGVLVSPGDFVPVAESTNIIEEIGAWVLDTAIADLARLRADGHPDVSMSVNVSAKQLRDDSLPGLVRETLAKHGVNGDCLGLEVTESMLVDDAQKAESVLVALAAQGVLVVLDDFGTGYSSLSRLRNMPISVLKIDKSFVAEIGHAPSALSLLAAITSMAEAMSITAVAEGVETEQQMAVITEMGCTFAQGFLFGRPAPLDTWLSAQNRQR
ncbi:hypothetical protein GCM10007304_09910 [Rhodococcoides trifolii]|uniref:EAL domain-containing protein n=1 Tax=Rhodococcoides trifolii TaxID=908250 RepID=A0A917FSG7_9NOCA|nr:bifunctional diguanylate cyclase/phosphodiesterase [Rhodococcus trifolii]GGF97975.1 hypothetical protein GCM10007304_09910 [Rhodococcus trifolii]